MVAGDGAFPSPRPGPAPELAPGLSLRLGSGRFGSPPRPARGTEIQFSAGTRGVWTVKTRTGLWTRTRRSLSFGPSATKQALASMGSILI